MSIAIYLQHIGRSATGAPGLTQDAARALMGEVLDGHASAAETGAFVMALRMRSPTLDELVGLLQAAQERCIGVTSARPVVLVPSYGGACRVPNLTPLLAMSLAREGLNVLVHGPTAEPSRVCSAAILADLGLAAAQQPQDIEHAWSRREPAFVPTALLCPALQPLLDLRALIGLRGPGHAVAQLLNPVRGAPALRLVGHNHAEAGALMNAWAQREGADAQLLRGTEGEPVADPRRLPRIDTWLAGVARPELSLPAREVTPTELPLLPRAQDVAGTAVYVQEVLSGSRPAPASLARQVALVKAAVTVLQARPTVQGCSA